MFDILNIIVIYYLSIFSNPINGWCCEENVPTIKTYSYEIKRQLEYSSSSHPTTFGDKSTIRYEIEQIKSKLFDIELILAERHNQTIDELKDYLDGLHSRVQLRPTSAPTLSPTDPTMKPTTDPTKSPTQDPTIPSANPTEDPTPAPSQDPTAPTVDPTVDPTMEPTLEPTYDPTKCPTETEEPTQVPTEFPTPAPTTTWVEVLTLGGNDNSYNGEIIDLKSVVFNSIFQTSDYHIIQRECATCSDDYQYLYYRRITDTESVDVYSLITSWSTDTGNVIMKDFMLFTSIQTALSNDARGLWFVCDPVTTSIGAFGECYKFPGEHEYCQYGLDANDSNFDPSDTCNKPTKFSIFVGKADYYNVTNDVKST